MPPNAKISAAAMSTDRREFVGALFLLLPLAYFVGQGVAQLASRAPYSAWDQTISELGVTTAGPFTNPITKESVYIDSPLHLVMNSAFVLYGVGVLVGVW